MKYLTITIKFSIKDLILDSFIINYLGESLSYLIVLFINFLYFKSILAQIMSFIIEFQNIIIDKLI